MSLEEFRKTDEYVYGYLGVEDGRRLAAIARGEIDIGAAVLDELANRGLDHDARWVGFPEARKIAEAAKGAPDKRASTDGTGMLAETSSGRLARAFAAELREELGTGEFAKLCEACLDAKGRASCPSHDMLDANMVMDAAFSKTFGRAADLESDEDMGLINRAWTEARGVMEREGKALLDADARAVVGTIKMGFESADTRMSDGLDFSDVAVWSARSELREAYLSGREAGLAEQARETRGLSRETENLRGFHSRVVGILQEVGVPSVMELAERLVDQLEKNALLESELKRAKLALAGRESSSASPETPKSGRSVR